MSPEPSGGYVRRTGRPPGFKPVHLVVAGVLAVVWLGLIAFVLTHGRDQASSVDVYSELPPGFTGALQAKGVTYQGLSSVDASTQQQALAHVPATAAGQQTGQAQSQPLVFRTSFSLVHRNGQAGPAAAALMVVVPTSGSAVVVDFIDPTDYHLLKTVSYAGASG